MSTNFQTREEWLVAAVEALGETVFAPANISLPPVRVSVGWPGGRGSKNNVIGQCWSTGAAKDKVANLFISPVLDDAARVLDVLAHELVHAVDDCQNGHKGPFATMAKAIGLTGSMRATVASDDLKATLSALVADTLGEYPHAALVTAAGTGSTPKQGTRMLKVACETTGYTARTTAKWLDSYGAPKCPCCDEEMQRA